MSSSAPRRSIDNAASPRPSSSSSSYPFPQLDVPQRPGASGRHAGGRGSGASSITSIGGILDPSTQSGHGTIVESGSNGLQDQISFASCAEQQFYSDRNLAPASHCPHGTLAACHRTEYAKAAVNEGYSSSNSDKYSPRRTFHLQIIYLASWVAL